MPILFSLFILYPKDKYEKGIGQQKVVIVQPNIDPYNEKFTGSYEQQLQKMLDLASLKVDSTTDYVIFPETALIEDIWEDELEKSKSLNTIKKFIVPFPKLKVIIGAATAKAYRQTEDVSTTARKFSNGEGYYDIFTQKVNVYNYLPDTISLSASNTTNIFLTAGKFKTAL